jgi:catechol 2,3-dioxygenase-like lactoylglutathione lyase family enzyme
MVLTHFIVSDDVERSRRFYTEVLDGHLIELGQTTDPAGDWSPDHWPSSTLRGRPVVAAVG